MAILKKDEKSSSKKRKNKNGLDTYATVDLQSLRDDNGHVDWVNSTGKTIKYTYMDNSGEILVKQVIDDKTILLEANNRIIPYSISSIINGQIIKLVNKTGKQSKNGHYKSTYSVGDIVKYKSQQYLILSVSYQTAMNTNEQLLKYGHIQYYVKCLTCGATFYKPAYLVEKTGCPICSNMEVFPGINDIPTTDPWMIDYFQGGIEEVKMYHSGTTKKYIQNVHHVDEYMISRYQL